MESCKKYELRARDSWLVSQSLEGESEGYKKGFLHYSSVQGWGLHRTVLFQFQRRLHDSGGVWLGGEGGLRSFICILGDRDGVRWKKIVVALKEPRRD